MQTCQTLEAGQFWSARFEKNGHTGWADPVLYAYDQQERIGILKLMIEAEVWPDRRALDFGCGTGDFSKMLMSLGFSVCGYDPYVSPAIRSPLFHHTQSQVGISEGEEPRALALAITTLDHILDEEEALQALMTIRRALTSGAKFWMVEYAIDGAEERQKFKMEKTGYQSFRLLSDWLSLLAKAGFLVERVQPMPHPILSPSLGCTAYRRSFLTRAARRLSGLPLMRGICNFVLKRHARTMLVTSPQSLRSISTSPLKLIQSLAN